MTSRKVSFDLTSSSHNVEKFNAALEVLADSLATAPTGPLSTAETGDGIWCGKKDTGIVIFPFNF